MKLLRKLAPLGFAAVLGLTACDEFIAPPTEDPNNIPEANIDQLFVGTQVNGYLFNGGTISRIASVWTQQMAGTARQWADFDRYTFNDGDFTMMNSLYFGGGLVDIRKARALAEASGRPEYEGILKIHEAWYMGLGASLWGDLPYSEAVNPEIDAPALDEQAEIYAALQSLLDEAVADLAAGPGVGGPAGADFNFGGDPAAWTAVAHSLKARLHMHWAEVDPSRYAMALAEAEQGISSASGTWVQVHSSATTEANPWNLFELSRSGDILAAERMVERLKATDDPRLQLYFKQATGDFAGEYVGSPPGTPAGDPGQQSSPLNVPATPAFGQAILSCAETQLIAAEASYQLGDEEGARQAMLDGIACQEDFWGVDIPEPDAALSGEDLLEEIMEQKWVALFLNPEAYNDYKRTCLPALGPAPGTTGLPGRFLYSDDEREANPNIPDPGDQPQRNDNDPNPC